MTGCEWVEGALAGYVGRELPAPAAAWLDRHLSRCPKCARLVGEYREVVRLAGSLPPAGPPPEAADRILAALRAAAGRPASGAMDETLLDTPLVPA